MSDRAALLAAIRADPRDDALRLVYADWLEEHGDEDDRELAAAIRQDGEPSYEQRQRSLGPPLNEGSWEHYEVFRAEFRRGMVERLVLPLIAFLDLAETLVERFPAFHRLVLTDLGGGDRLARCPALAAVRDLTIGDRLPAGDALALATSPHLRGLLALRLWAWDDLSHVNDCLPLASLTALEEVELLQVNGGAEDGDVAEERERVMDEIAQRFARRTRAAVRVVRPYAKLFPLDGDIEYCGLFAGHTRGGRPTLVHGGRQAHLLFFHDDGRLSGQRSYDLDAALVRPPEYSWQTYNEQEFLEHLHRLDGFTLGRIHVREISLDDLSIGISYMDEPRDVLYWHEGDNFEINCGGDSGWAGPDGKVHST